MSDRTEPVIHPGQRWRAASARDDVIDVVRQVDDWLWLVRTELGLMVEMTDTYLLSSFELVSVGEVAVIDRSVAS